MIFFLVFHVISVVLAIIGASEEHFGQQLRETQFRGINDPDETILYPKTKRMVVVPKVAQNIPDQVLEAERLMKDFVDVLRDFVHGTVFDFTSFELKMKDLEEQLTNITISVTNVSPCKELAEKLNGAKNYYDVMAETAESIRRYKNLGIAVFQWSPRG